MNEHVFLLLDAVGIAYDRNTIVQNVTFSLHKGKCAALSGCSGSGKTTLLRAIAGFQPVQTGSISLDHQDLSCPGFTLPPEQRNIGMIFQDFALFPHLNVRDNIRFGIHSLTRKMQQLRIAELLDLVDLADYSLRYPHTLSGGQQQRIALARALASRPRLLLMDEPFSSLDSDLRRSLAQKVRKILEIEGTTSLLVTHDSIEANEMSEKIGVMKNGHLNQWSNAEKPYKR